MGKTPLVWAGVAVEPFVTAQAYLATKATAALCPLTVAVLKAASWKPVAAAPPLPPRPMPLTMGKTGDTLGVAKPVA